MNRSETIGKIGMALAKFNIDVEGITKDSVNPHFKNKFASLDTLIANTKPVLAKHGLTIMQFPINEEGGSVGIETMLLHESGEYIQANPFYLKPTKADPQGCGSAITYARRYSYQAILNLNMENDDDANACSLAPTPTRGGNKITDAQVKRLLAIGFERGFDISAIKKSVLSKYKARDLTDMNKVQYDEFVAKLEVLPKEENK